MTTALLILALIALAVTLAWVFVDGLIESFGEDGQ